MSEQPPPLPREVSANGAELWDWAIRLSHWEQRQEKIRRLRAEIAHVRCGDCRLWMTKACPRERNVNGHSRGPSMNGPLCSRFEEKPYCAEDRERKRAELASLESRP